MADVEQILRKRSQATGCICLKPLLEAILQMRQRCTSGSWQLMHSCEIPD